MCPVIELDAVFAIASTLSISHVPKRNAWLPQWLPSKTAAVRRPPLTCTCSVELRGFEPLTPSMRTRCATGLRYSPWNESQRSKLCRLLAPPMSWPRSPVRLVVDAPSPSGAGQPWPRARQTTRRRRLTSRRRRAGAALRRRSPQRPARDRRSTWCTCPPARARSPGPSPRSRPEPAPRRTWRRGRPRPSLPPRSARRWACPRPAWRAGPTGPAPAAWRGPRAPARARPPAASRCARSASACAASRSSSR